MAGSDSKYNTRSDWLILFEGRILPPRDEAVSILCFIMRQWNLLHTFSFEFCDDCTELSTFQGGWEPRSFSYLVK